MFLEKNVCILSCPVRPACLPIIFIFCSIFYFLFNFCFLFFLNFRPAQTSAFYFSVTIFFFPSASYCLRYRFCLSVSLLLSSLPFFLPVSLLLSSSPFFVFLSACYYLSVILFLSLHFYLYDSGTVSSTALPQFNHVLSKDQRTGGKADGKLLLSRSLNAEHSIGHPVSAEKIPDCIFKRLNIIIRVIGNLEHALQIIVLVKSKAHLVPRRSAMF